ncbi:carbohydrate ABC transporter permease [Enterocloster lavalensis]|uniref:carbohydrate ABC transporter permease n=1 Tax=Enterocloster lavalensis TaxID=460384 RepID=UPI001D09650F|nr:sugar ABC transporter permease [Enterocloster lavalensis]MCB6345120.1 sugar ABC transporter permease [Enterocloster lavalensis]
MARLNKKAGINPALVRKRRLTALAFLLPNLIGFLLFTLIPVMTAFVLSFMEWDSANPAKFVGLKNFMALFRTRSFRVALWNTIYYTVGVVPLTIVVSLALAVLFSKPIRGIAFFRAAHYFPYLASIVAVAGVWQFLYNADAGPINMFLKSIGVANPPRWTASTTWAMPAVIIMNVWRSCGYYMIMFVSGIQAIPSHLYEAAMLDGAGGFQRFRYVTLPMLSPTMFFVSIICIINSFKVFGAIYVMTQGGPGGSTSVLVYEIYTQAFSNFKFGFASAEALVLFLLIFIVTLIQYRGQEKWVNYMT